MKAVISSFNCDTNESAATLLSNRQISSGFDKDFKQSFSASFPIERGWVHTLFQDEEAAKLWDDNNLYLNGGKINIAADKNQ